MGNCFGKKQKTIDELLEEQIKIRKTQIAPGPVSKEIKEHINRDKKLIKEDLEKPPVSNLEYKIDETLKPTKISEEEFKRKLNIVIEDNH